MRELDAMRKRFGAVKFKPNQLIGIRIQAPVPLVNENVFIARNPGSIVLTIKLQLSEINDELKFSPLRPKTKVQAIKSILENKYNLRLPKTVQVMI